MRIEGWANIGCTSNYNGLVGIKPVICRDTYRADVRIQSWGKIFVKDMYIKPNIEARGVGEDDERHYNFRCEYYYWKRALQR